MTESFSAQETIAAIATSLAVGQGGIAVVRVSGPNAEQAVKSVVLVPGSQLWETHRVLYGYVMDELQENRIDEVLILIMRAPRSFTGEDVVEIHCHGGLIAVQLVLERVLAQEQVRLAQPGEFSQRAVLNGRLDLTKAESISQLINARSRRAAQIAMSGLDGGINQQMSSLRRRLLDQLSEIEARIDFEDELPAIDEIALLKNIKAVKSELKQLVLDAYRGAFIRQGLRIALIGRPNVGKSSLLNRLSRKEKAIVSKLPGTTRDLLESEIVLEGVPITLLDTAGIRSTEDELEKIGIDRSYKALLGADIVVFIFDLSLGWTDEDTALLSKIPQELPKILIGNKSDLQSPKLETCIEEKEILTISALTGQGEQEFIDSLLRVSGVSGSRGILILLNERQRNLAKNAIEALGRCEEVANQGMPWDFWTIDLRQAIYALGEITGEEITEAVLDQIFSKFCIGK